jgi:hypothetical protein
MKKYTTIQMERDLYDMVKPYCKENGYTISGYIHRLILKDMLPKQKSVISPVNVLHVNKKPTP